MYPKLQQDGQDLISEHTKEAFIIYNDIKGMLPNNPFKNVRIQGLPDDLAP